ncbi:MAG TPA: hypothetical protein VFE96_03250 [Candidatus Bathyarchaeia archaeon]|nr:hypothetical protein [Candidatus Bathyarchaeia archaeon]
MLSELTSPTRNDSGLRPIKFAGLRFARGDDFLYRFGQDSIEEAKSLGADVLVFCDRPWLGETVQFPLTDRVEVALLPFNNFDEWFAGLKKDTRNEIRKGEKRGVENRIIKEFSVTEAQEIVDIFRESPFREGRYFEGYHHWTLERVLESFKTNGEFITLTAVYEGKIVGVARTKFRGQVAVINNLLSSLAIRRKIIGVSNSLLATQIKMLGDRGVRYLAYGKMGVLGGLDHFRVSNGFQSAMVNYNYVLLTQKAKILAKFKIYQPRDLLFSTKLRFIVPLSIPIQKHIPTRLIQKFHLYA